MPRPQTPIDGVRGFMRERARMSQILRAGEAPDRPGRVAWRRDMAHSTHWTLAARRARTMTRMRVFVSIGRWPSAVEDLTVNDRRELETFASFLRDSAKLKPPALEAKWQRYMDGESGGPGCL